MCVRLKVWHSYSRPDFGGPSVGVGHLWGVAPTESRTEEPGSLRRCAGHVECHECRTGEFGSEDVGSVTLSATSADQESLVQTLCRSHCVPGEGIVEFAPCAFDAASVTVV